MVEIKLGGDSKCVPEAVWLKLEGANQVVRKRIGGLEPNNTLYSAVLFVVEFFSCL